MKNILVLNSGSTSVKYKLFKISHKTFKEIEEDCINKVKDHKKILIEILNKLNNTYEIHSVGHRVVHGGDKFTQPTLVNKIIIKELEEFNKLAPLHNPYNLIGIKLIHKILPKAPQVAVFDTAFYADMPKENQIYPISQKIADKYKIKRYGFHGISHQFVSQVAAQKLNKKLEKLNLISIHMGGGWSITAIKNGKAINTSMGWTPLEGLMMMTRSGDIDPGVIIELLKTEGASKAYNILNRESGIKGVSGGIDDFLELLKAIAKCNNKAKLAFEMAIDRLIKYISYYWVELGGKVDGIIFTGAIGAGSALTRKAVIKKIKCLGKTNAIHVKTNEELMIAKEVVKALSQNQLRITN